jgi:pilus assembly protein Flp/PilA
LCVTPDAAIAKEDAMLATFKRLATNESGATAIEYGLICAFIGLFILSALHVVGAELIASLSKLLTAFG